jgi:hypothetical protein
MLASYKPPLNAEGKDHHDDFELPQWANIQVQPPDTSLPFLDLAIHTSNASMLVDMPRFFDLSATPVRATEYRIEPGTEGPCKVRR